LAQSFGRLGRYEEYFKPSWESSVIYISFYPMIKPAPRPTKAIHAREIAENAKNFLLHLDKEFLTNRGYYGSVKLEGESPIQLYFGWFDGNHSQS